ncbi:MAG: protein kinase, partial [Sandaracinaceae bacterium]
MDAPEQPILLAGRYAYVRELGRGGAGRLILAADVASGARRAIKVVPEQEAERLRWERAHLDRVAHPALAEVYELLTLGERLRAPWGLERGAAALVEEHVEGVSAWRRASEIPAEARVAFTVTIAARVARALGAIHSASLVHGDVKPANIVVGDDPGQAKLVDLGLAQPAGLAVAIGGTAGYLAPEVLLGERLPAGDLYALGATMHALLTRRSADDSQASATDPERGWTRRPELRELGPEVPIALRRLIGDLIAERASDRPASAGEVALRLDAIASELGIALADDVAVSTAPSPIERATRARAVRFTGREAALSQLVAALREPGVVAVLGPEGAGRTRAIREAVRALQAERGWSATYVHDTGARPPRLTHDAIVHLAAEPIDWDACARAVDAASLAGTALTVVAPAGRGPEGVRSVELGPLPQDGVRSLLAELLQVDPSPALVDAACEASGALPGRLCRLVATALEEGREPARPATLRELGGRAGADAWEVRDLPLAALTSVAGGSLRAEDARGIVEEAAAEAHRLLASGWATVTESGRLTLREDLVRSVYAGLDASARAGWARALDGVELDAAARACVDAALGRVDRAVQSMLSAMRGARTRGEPERAAMLAQRLTDRIGSVPIELARAHADALRALAREEEALDVLAAADDEASRTDRAELLRLLGRSDDATAALDGCESAAASRVRARIALGRGDASSALESIAHVESTDDEEAARLAEIRALAALAAGRFDDARAAAQEGLRAAARCDDPAIEARASSVDGSVLCATGRTGEAASRYERAFELAERAGERYAAASYLVNVGLGRF